MTGKVSAYRVLNLLSQDQRWQTSDGRTVRLNDMTAAHRRAALTWLRAHAEGLHAAHHTETPPGPDEVTDKRAAAAWLENTPLVARLATPEWEWRLRRWSGK